MSLSEIIGLVRQLGYSWAPRVLALLLVFFVARECWKLRYPHLLSWGFIGPVVGSTGIAILGLVVFYRYWGVPKSFRSEEVGILVAEIPGDTDRRQQNSYVSAIRELVANTPDIGSVVKVRLLERPLPSDPDDQHRAALDLARRLGAALVIRPVPVEGGHSLWITIADRPEFSTEETTLGYVTQSQLAQIRSLPLPGEIALIARCVLALSYFQRQRFDQAIKQFKNVLSSPELPPAAPPRPYLNFLLGTSYNRVSSPAPDSDLKLAIAAFDETLIELPRDSQPLVWAATFNNRGNAYRGLRGPDRAANLQEALRSYDTALQILNAKAHPEEWALVVTNKAVALAEVPAADADVNLRLAIGFLDDALAVYTVRGNPSRWAMVMHNRGVAYRRLQGPNREANLREAIRNFDLCLEIRRRDRFPLKWAVTMNARGSAYGELPGPDRTANVREAIRCFDSVLEVRTRERYAVAWAETMSNRAGAFALLPEGDRDTNLREAIRCYDLALEVRKRDSYPFDWAITTLNRAEAYLQLDGPEGAGNVGEAVRGFESALEVFQGMGLAQYAADCRARLDGARKLVARSH